MKSTAALQPSDATTRFQAQQTSLRNALGPLLVPRVVQWLRDTKAGRQDLSLHRQLQSALRLLRAGELQIVIDGPPEDPNSRFRLELTRAGVIASGGRIQ